MALREFRSWYSNYADTWLLKAAHYQPWLQLATAPHIASCDYFPYFRTEFDSTVSTLFQDWSITASAADTWPQHHLTHQMKEKLRATFLATLPADDEHRLEQVSLSSIPTRASTPDISRCHGPKAWRSSLDDPSGAWRIKKMLCTGRGPGAQQKFIAHKITFFDLQAVRLEPTSTPCQSGSSTAVLGSLPMKLRCEFVLYSCQAYLQQPLRCCHGPETMGKHQANFSGHCAVFEG